MTLMPWVVRRVVEALELDTAACTLRSLSASASMNASTVEPVPTPRIMPSRTYASAASAAFFFFSFASRAMRKSCVYRGFEYRGRVSTATKEEARLRGLGLLLRFGERGKIFRAHRGA